MAWLWWIAIMIVFGLIEVLSLDLVFLMLAGGALVAAIPAAFDAPFWVQVVTFAVASVLLLVAVRPWALRRLHRRDQELETGVAAHVGRPAVVVIDVNVDGGRVKLAGEVWTARAAYPGVVYPEGSDVQVMRIEGATAIVGPPGSVPIAE